MKNNKLILEIKPFLVLVTYAVGLGALVLNFSTVLNFLGICLRYLKPMFIALGVAYVLNIPMRGIEKFLLKRVDENSKLRTKIRGIAIFLTTIIVLSLIVAFLLLIAPQLIKSLLRLAENISGYVENLINIIVKFLNEKKFDDNSILEKLEELGNVDWDGLVVSFSDWLFANSKELGQTAGKSLSQLLNGFINGTVKIGGSFGTWFTGIIISFYLLASKEKFIRQARKLVAVIFNRKYTEIIFGIAKQANRIYSSFITGQLLESFILSAIMLTVMTILRMEYALLICLVLLVASLVPVFGAIFTMFFGAFLIFSINPLQAVWFIIVYQIIQELETNLIYPKVVGESVGLPGVWVLLSIIIFGGLFGVLGMLIAVPTSALLYQLTCELVNYLLKKKNVVIDMNGFVDDNIDEIKE